MVKLCDRLSELDVLLNYIEPEEWVKIPDNVIFYIKENKNNEYVWEYDETKSLEEQNLSKETFSLLTFIMYKYIASNEERKEIEKLLEENIKSYQQMDKTAEDIVSRKENENVEILSEQKETNLIKIEEKNETFFKRILASIKKIFEIN